LKLNPIRLTGDWEEGFALDYNAKKISWTGSNIFGYPKLNYEYTEIGEILYYMKEFDEYAKCQELADIMAEFLRSEWKIADKIDGIIAAPVTADLPNAPLYKLVKMIGDRTEKPVSVNFFAKLTVGEIKALDDREKIDIYRNNIKKMKKLQSRGNILVVDDFYNTGTTMKSLAGLLKEDINLDKLYVLTAVLNKKID
jgi:predicted amidophosphoribosyltransferase